MDRSLAREAIEVLFDFSTSPVNYELVHNPRTNAKRKSSQSDREPPGMKVEQNIFLDSIATRRVDPTPIQPVGELDQLAMAIADLKGYDGIYCLSGVRGSGKSTVLNRIAWFCRCWYEGTGNSPPGSI